MATFAVSDLLRIGGGGLESAKKSRIAIKYLAGNPRFVREEVIPMLASIGPPDTALTSATRWALRAERALRLAVMLSIKDAAAVEAYAKECEARARDATERPTAQRLLAA